MKDMIRIPSAEFGDKYSALNRKSVDIFIKILENTKSFGLICLLKEKDNILEGIRKNYISDVCIVSVTICDSSGKKITRNISGYYSRTQNEVLLTERDVFDFLVKCTKPERIEDVKWNDKILIPQRKNEIYGLDNKNIEKQSLCRVLSIDELGTRRLKRLGDITTDGYIQPFIFDESLPKFFGNRPTIYWKDGPTEEGFVGVWDWSAIPNKSGADSDYVESKYNENLIPTEIIELPRVHSVDLLIEQLKEGIDIIPKCNKVIFAYRFTSDGYEGVLCDKKMLKLSRNKISLNEEVNSLMVFYFNEGDIFKTKTQEFYRFLRLDDYDKIVLTKTPVEIVKSIVLKRASWSVGKQFGMSKAEWKTFRSFVQGLTIDTFFQEICNECNCDEYTARGYFNDFLVRADDILESGDIDISVMTSVVENSDTLRLQCEKIVEEKWLKEHKKDLKQSVEELENINKDVNRYKKLLEEIKTEIKEKKSILDKLKIESNEYEELLNRTVENVNHKLEKAKSDVTDFAGEISFLSAAMGVSKSPNVQVSDAYKFGIVCEDSDLSYSYKESIRYISDELAEAGVESRYRNSFACFLFSTYINKVHLFLAGPNGESIANALSAALFGKLAGVIDCNYPYDSDTVQKALSSDDNVIIVKHPFSNGWIYNIIEETQTSDKLFVYVNAISEDLSIEPKGLFNYCLPVFTESFIDNVPTNCFVGSIKSDVYDEYKSKKQRPLYSEYFNNINISTFLYGKIQRILNDMHSLYNESDVTADYLYVFLAYAYLTKNGNSLVEQIDSENNIDDDKRKYMLRFLGDNDD